MNINENKLANAIEQNADMLESDFRRIELEVGKLRRDLDAGKITADVYETWEMGFMAQYVARVASRLSTNRAYAQVAHMQQTEVK